MEYLILFLTAFIASTLFPMGSELVLLGLINQGHNAFLLWLVATSGNTLGSCVNYALGYWASDYIEHKYNESKSWHKAQAFYNHYGLWSLLFSWLPIIGDPITLIAGLAQTRFRVFFLLVALGKGARYAVLIAMALLAA